jgi:hypothetical protein
MRSKCVYFLQLLFSLLNNPLFAPRIIQALKNPVSPLMLYLLHSSKKPAYWWSTPAPIALFVKVSPGRACNDYNLPFLCSCEMTNLSATFFISQTFALSLTDNTYVIWKHPVVIVETFKVKVYLAVSRHYLAQPFCPVLVLAFVFGNFLVARICAWHHFLGVWLYSNYTIGHQNFERVLC